jgi:tripartite ATP-independent transporter DctP family solute receptor
MQFFKRSFRYHRTSYFLTRITFTSLTGLMLLLALSACGDSATATPVSTGANTPGRAIPTADLGNSSPATTAAVNSTSGATPSASAQTAANGSAAIKIRVSYPGEKTTGNGQMAARFADLVTKKTGGRVEFEFYPNSSIAGGDQLTAINMVRADKLEAVISQASFFGTIDPVIELLNYPFLFNSRQDAFRFLDSQAGKQLLDGLEQYNFKVLGFNDQGFRQISNSKRPVVSPADLAGLKIRIPQSNLYTRVLKALGAEPVTMNFSPELYKALQVKTLDGQDAPIMFSLTNKYQEVLPYTTLVNYSWDPLLLNFSVNFWKGLPADIQKALTEAGTEVTQVFNNEIDNNEKTALDQFKAAGVQVVKLTPEQHQAFVNATSAIYQAAQQQYGKEMLDKIIKAAQG